MKKKYCTEIILDGYREQASGAIKKITERINELNQKGIFDIEILTEEMDNYEETHKVVLQYWRSMTEEELKEKDNRDNFHAEQEKIVLRKLYKKYGQEAL